MIIGASAETEGARALWAALQTEIRGCDPAEQLQLSRALADGRSYEELPVWARRLLGRVVSELLSGAG